MPDKDKGIVDLAQLGDDDLGVIADADVPLVARQVDGDRPETAAAQLGIVAGRGPRVINGEPSVINYLDALNAFELVREADAATGKPAAASFKHVSPAGAALAGAVDATAARIWRVDEAGDGGLLSAYVRARDADPESSFGDVAALSRPVGPDTAEFLRTVICDAVIAPGFEPGTAGVLAAKRGGGFLVLEADPGRVPPASERRDVLGVTIEQEQIRFAGQEMTAEQLGEFESLFGAEARSRYEDAAWREEWIAALSGVTMTSDGYLPFRDNVEHAAAAGVTAIVEAGGSTRASEVADSAAAHNIAHVQTGLCLFHR